MPTTRTEIVTTADGREMAAHVALPDAVVAVAGRRPGFEADVEEDAGHAFDNHDAPRFHQPEAAARAWKVTEDFLGRTLTPA